MTTARITMVQQLNLQQAQAVMAAAIAEAMRHGYKPMAVIVVVLGAVGASGGTGDEDEAICAAGIRAAGFLPA